LSIRYWIWPTRGLMKNSNAKYNIAKNEDFADNVIEISHGWEYSSEFRILSNIKIGLQQRQTGRMTVYSTLQS